MLLVPALGGLSLLWLGRPRGPDEPEPPPPSVHRDAQKRKSDSPSRASGASPSGSPPTAPGKAGGPTDEETAATARELGITPRELWQKRLQRAQSTLDSYLESTRYPPTARPISEKPDLMKPRFEGALTAKQPLARADRKVTDAKVTTRQDRMFVAGDEAITFYLSCENSDGPQRCQVDQAMLEASDPPAPLKVAARFADEGQPGDDKADDNVYSYSVKPLEAGFAGYHGTIKLSATVKVGSEDGAVHWSAQLTPQPPADFTGKVREHLDKGSLELFVGMNVRKAGRYVLAARVDDASGKSFAYLDFNEELEAGEREAKLTLFGKLIIDQKAEAPFKVRDLEGFLLRESHPDRELMKSIEGPVHTTQRYASSQFSEAEWQSEEKERHVKEFTRDVEQAKTKLDEQGGKGEAPP